MSLFILCMQYCASIYGILGCCKNTWWTQDLFGHLCSPILVNCDSVHHLAQAFVKKQCLEHNWGG